MVTSHTGVLLAATGQPYIYVVTTYAGHMLAPDLKKGSAEFLVLSLLEHERRHGYELNKLIEMSMEGSVG